MARPKDTDRVIWYLQEQGRSSNRSVREAVGLSDDRYAKVRDELLAEGIVEKAKGQGGGLQLTQKGQKEETLPDAKSSVDGEMSLYRPFLDVLQAEADENEDAAMVIDTSALRKSGKWSNPDLTKISVRRFQILRSHRILISTYELKQWKRWNIDAVFEAASQHRFAHEANLVLEWAKGEPVIGLEDMMAVCSRFGVGLLTMHPHYRGFRYDILLEPETILSSEDYVEEYLSYVFDKYPKERQRFDKLCDGQGI